MKDWRLERGAGRVLGELSPLASRNCARGAGVSLTSSSYLQQSQNEGTDLLLLYCSYLALVVAFYAGRCSKGRAKLWVVRIEAKQRDSTDMSHKLEFFFDCSSPWTYLAFSQIEGLAKRTGSTLHLRPILVGGVFNAVNQSVYETRANPVPAKAVYMAKDMADWARAFGLTIKWPPSVFPVRAVDAMRAVAAAEERGAAADLSWALFRAYWGEDKDISDRDILAQLGASVGLDGKWLVERLDSDAIKSRLRENTEELVSRGGFGSPTIYIDGTDMYFGNDRLWLVEQALMR